MTLAARDVVVRFARNLPPVLDRACIEVPAGATVGLAGPSGCGKSTLARVLALLLAPESGTLTLDGEHVRTWRYTAPSELRTRLAVVFQQARLAVDPRLRLADVVVEPLRATGRAHLAAERLEELASAVDLSDELLGRRPHEVSDGQLQRACVARSLVLEPRYVICDEMTSMLDPSTQAQLVGVVEDYRRRTGAGVLAISHDEVLLSRWCDRVERLPAATTNGH